MNWQLFARIIDFAISNAIPIVNVVSELLKRAGGKPEQVTDELFEEVKASIKPPLPSLDELKEQS